jgi:predicted oxidoreductase
LHVADALLQPQEAAQALDDLHRSGKVRYFGVSNYNGAQILLLKKYVQQPLVVNQIRMGLGYSHPIVDGMDFALQLAKGEDPEEGFTAVAGNGVLDYCRLHDIQIQAWSPLRGSFLRAVEEVEPRSRPLVQLLRDLAKQKETSPSAIAIAWLLRHPAGIVPIVGSSQPEHIAQNCEADQVLLTSEEWYALLALTSDRKRRSI